MSPAELEGATQRLREIAERLSDPQIADDEAERLAREAADLVGTASAALERELREPPGEGR